MSNNKINDLLLRLSNWDDLKKFDKLIIKMVTDLTGDDIQMDIVACAEFLADRVIKVVDKM